MTAIGISGPGLTGVIRMTRVQDNLAHVVDHSHTHETTGTWTGLACPTYGPSPGTDVDNAVLRPLPPMGRSPTWPGKPQTTSPPTTARPSRHARAYRALGLGDGR